jgi:hypothetical protein
MNLFVRFVIRSFSTAVMMSAAAQAAKGDPLSGKLALESPDVAVRMAEPPALVLARSKVDLAAKTQIAQQLYYIGDARGRWDVDLDIGTIEFSGPTMTTTAPVQVIGTYNTNDGTWLWGWDHPSVPPEVAVAAKAMKAYGERHGIEAYTTRKIACSEEEAWQFAAVASYLTGAQGAYRGPSGPTLVFMTYGTVTLKKAP